MVQGNAILVVDLGNSSTKGMVLFGKDSKTGRYRERQFDIPNVFAAIPENYEVSSDYNDLTSTILRCDTELNGLKITGCFCNGELQEKEFSLNTIRPTAKRKKYDLDSTVLSYRLAFLFACKAIMSMQNITDYDQLKELSWTVVTLLPPGDLDNGKDKLASIVKAIDSIDILYPQVNLPVKTNNVYVFPEGYCAYAGVVYDKGHTFRGDYQFLTEETVLVIDIGAGTTDICMIKDNKLVQNSKYTIDLGGNNVEKKVKDYLLQDGLMLDVKDVQTGIIKGFVKDGAKKVSIIDYVNNAKRDVAGGIIRNIIDYLESKDINTRTIGYVLICGGGSINDSEAPEINSLSNNIMEQFKQFVPNSEVIDIPLHTVKKEMEDGDVKTVEEPINPRDLNLVGASILAEII